MGKFSNNPEVKISAANSIAIGGDGNSPGVWVNSEMKEYVSHYPSGLSMGGVAGYAKYAPNIETFVPGGISVSGDRAFLDTFNPPAYGPWFEAMISDEQGNLYSYYHTEIRVYSDTKIRVGIGCQKSLDGGNTWIDIGNALIVNTPAGSDIADGVTTHLNYGFVGGNGDCSAILDHTQTYLYIFWSQYGKTSETQGIGMGRMLWSDRNSPEGKILKWYNDAWVQPGVGGLTTPVIPNGGDCYGLFAVQDYWWGPAIHWNEYIEKYVVLLNRSNNGDFYWTNGQTNYWAYCSDLANPIWSTPQELVFSDGSMGNWYPICYGLQPGAGTDKFCGQTGRLFVSGISNWSIRFYRPFEDPNPPVISAGRIRQ